MSKPVAFMSMLLILLFAFVSAAQADGLFDFQMKLAQKGNAEAQFKVGEMYETGFGVKQDMDEARNWISKAAAKGHETAGFKLLYWDLEKNGVNGDNKAKLDDLNAKADAGNPQAQYYLGKMHARGIGVKKNPDKAISLLNKAALVGVLEAEREVAVVREERQRQLAAQRRAEEKRKAEARARQERERQAKLAEQQRLEAEKQAQAKARAAEVERKNREAEAAKAKAQQQAQEKERLLAQQQAAERQREAERQALIKKREAEEKARKAQFESDPCSGKSARFLSTCR